MCLVALLFALLVTGPSATPSISLVSLTPLTLRGAGFVPGEAVRVELAVGRGRKRPVRTARATSAGSFRVRYVFVALEPCRGSVVATATGSRGSRASWKRPCRPPHEQPPSVG